ncbi:MAG: tripartite tricarboxylate transporter substrate-binding protein [Pseudomonadota bacterium]
MFVENQPLRPSILDFRPGAGLTIGTAIAAKANPDGYTLLEGIISPLAINVTLYKLPYDPVKDFAPISLIARLPAVLVLHPSIPARNLKELIALAKKHPGKLTYGSAGIGTSGNLFAELFKIRAGVNILHVPYKGGGPAIIALLSGEISMEISGTAGSMAHIKSGRFRALAVTGAKRTPVLPDVPTMIESGVAVEGTAWYSVVAPAGTPTLIVNQLRDAVIYAVESPRVRQLLLDQGAVPETSTPEELRDLISSEIVKWAEVIRLSGIKSE